MRWFRWLRRVLFLPPGPTVTLPRLVITRYRILFGVLAVLLAISVISLRDARRDLHRSETILGEMDRIAQNSEALATLYASQINHHVAMNALWSKVQQSKGSERKRALAQYHLSVAAYNERTREVIAHCEALRETVKRLEPLLEARP